MFLPIRRLPSVTFLTFQHDEEEGKKTGSDLQQEKRVNRYRRTEATDRATALETLKSSISVRFLQQPSPPSHSKLAQKAIYILRILFVFFLFFSFLLYAFALLFPCFVFSFPASFPRECVQGPISPDGLCGFPRQSLDNYSHARQRNSSAPLYTHSSATNIVPTPFRFFFCFVFVCPVRVWEKNSPNSKWSSPFSYFSKEITFFRDLSSLVLILHHGHR